MSTDYNPFQSPAAAPSSQPGVGAAWPIVPFQSGNQRATVAMALLAIEALIFVVGAISSTLQYTMLVPQPDGSFLLTTTGKAIQDGAGLLGGASSLVWIGTVVAFCMWTHRAARNLPALGARGLKYTPGWAVGWFFIPFANLVMPYFVAAEIWRESDPAQKDLDGQGAKTTSPLVAGWWLSYVVYWVVPGIAGAVLGFTVAYSIAAHHADPQEVARGMTHYLPQLLLLGLGAQALGLLAAILAILYVYRVNANQQAKFDSIHGGGYMA